MVKFSSSSKQKQTGRAAALLQKSQPYAPKKKDKDAKAAEIGRLCEAAQSHPFVYVGEPKYLDGVTVRSLKDFLRKTTGTTIMYSKNSLVKVALGKDETSEVAPGLAKLASSMTGNVCMLFSSSDPETVQAAIDGFLEDKEAYVGAGAVASETVVVAPGPVTTFTSTQEPLLRRLGAPVTLDKGVIVFTKECVVCSEGHLVSAASAKLLRLLHRPLARPALTLLRVATDGKVTTLASSSPSAPVSNATSNTTGMEDDDADREVEEDMVVEEKGASSHAIPPAPRRSKKVRESKPLKVSRRKR